MFKNFPCCVVKEFLCSITFAFILFLIVFGVFVSSAHAQTAPACTANWQSRSCSTYPTPIANGGSCQPVSTDGILVAGPNQTSQYGYERFYCNTSCNGFNQFAGYYAGKCNYMATACPEGQSWRNDGATASCQPDNVETPQDCGITGFPVWNGSGYTCEADFNTPCPEGTVNGNYTMPGYDPRPYCADGSTPNSSSAGSASSSGQNSSANNSDGSDDGEGSGSSSGNNNSSSAPAGCPVPANSTCPNKYEVNGQWYCTSGGAHCPGGGNSSSTSSGSGGSASSAGAGECDPTAKDYLQCLDSKELVLPEETGAFDETVAQDKIAEAEAELRDVIEQIQSEIHDTFGTSLNGSGGLSDYCYNIMSVQVCFGWSRFSQYLTVIGQAILAAAYVAAFIIVMRQ